MRALVLIVLVALLAGCQKKPAPMAAYGGTDARIGHRSPAGSPSQPAEADAAVADATAPKTAAAPLPAAAALPAGAPMMAYSYAYGVEAAPSHIRGLEAKHEQACAAAGPAVCVVVGSQITEQGRDQVEAKLTLRAVPAWLAAFKAGLAKDADDAGGRVTRAEVASEDLSRQIVDTEATLKAKTTLRDRLQDILATRPGKVSDLLEVETSLSDVQGQIDTTTSELAMMRQRVTTSELEVNYDSAGVLAPQGVFAPLGRAFSGFLGTVVQALAAMVSLVAWLGPWILVLGGLIWLFRKRLPRPRWSFGRKAKADDKA